MRSSKVLNSNLSESNRICFICCSFLALICLLVSLVIFYISNNIILTRLGYRLIELENCKVNLEEQNKKLELNVETLSALDRIEKIACNHLGMIRPKKVEFIALATREEIGTIENIGIMSNNYERRENCGARFYTRDFSQSRSFLH